MRIEGIIPPLLSPLTKDKKIDEISVKRLIEHCITGGVNGVFVLGSCGEGTVLDSEQRKKMVQTSLEAINGRVPLMVGILETSSMRVLEEIKEYEKMGIEYYVVTPPYYLQSTGQEEILRHYQMVADNTRGKVIIYNIPAYVHTDILPETMMKLLGISNIVAVKDSSSDWALVQKNLLGKKEQVILSGNEDLCGAAMLFGADGCVPCLANIYPAFYRDMYRYAMEKNVKKVLEYQKAIIEMKEVFKYSKSWIGVVKYLCARKGIVDSYYVGLDTVPMSEEEKNNIDAYLSEHEKMY